MDQLEKVKQLLETGVDAAVILDSDRRILFYNRAYALLTGLRSRKIESEIARGARCFELFPLEICENECAGCRGLAAGKAIRVDEIRSLRTVGNEKRTFIVVAVPLPELDVMVETYRDVTAEVRIQSRLKELLARERQAKELLEREVEARTDALRQAQAQLVHQEKMSGLGRLVAGIAHEMNNPINFVYGNVDFLGQYMEDVLKLVDLIDRGDLPAELREQFEAKKVEIEFDFLVTDATKLIRSIRSGAERTATIVQDLKRFSRTGGGELQEADIVSGIETTLNLIAPLLQSRIKVKRDFAKGLPRLICNAGHINQVFMNILTNAAQAIEGEGTIEVTIDQPEDQDVIRVVVSDDGPGITEETIEKITDPFFTTKDVGEGTGLGLWISENIVRAHGGKLQWESEVGQGAVFTVTLPITAPDTAKHNLASGHVSPSRLGLVT